MPDKILFSWSGGKDSALALHSLRNHRNFEVVALMTTVTSGYDRISMHGVRQRLLEEQAQSIGLPLEKVVISKKSSNEDYEAKIEAVLLKYKSVGVGLVAFGDIFLEDLKRHREENLAKIGMKGIFPLWKQSTYILARKFIDLKFKAIITCVDGTQLDGKFCGRAYDRSLMSDLPRTVDPCGENGEFHTFVYAGPIFKDEIPFAKGGTVVRDNRFYFCDLIG